MLCASATIVAISAPAAYAKVDVVVTNTIDQPVPVQILGTPSVNIDNTPSVSVTRTPSVRVTNSAANPVAVHDATGAFTAFREDRSDPNDGFSRNCPSSLIVRGDAPWVFEEVAVHALAPPQSIELRVGLRTTQTSYIREEFYELPVSENGFASLSTRLYITPGAEFAVPVGTITEVGLCYREDPNAPTSLGAIFSGRYL